MALLGELAGVVDGVRLHPLVLDEDLGVLSRLVIPPLIADRVVRRPLPGETFRAVLGLRRPPSRYSTPPSAEGASQ